ncbi:hypothetical protein C5167_007245 [Papaver somniferum]|nr:hypothetical protein C5167_007245 [Papaver somniferum]
MGKRVEVRFNCELVLVVNGAAQKKLKDKMAEFQTLRQHISREHREDVERRVFTVTGSRADEQIIDQLIVTGDSDQILQKAIQEHGRGQVMDSLAEIQERHGAVKSGTMFDNVLVCDDPDYAKKLTEETWGKQKEGEKAAFDEELELCLGREDDTTFEKQSAPFALAISDFVEQLRKRFIHSIAPGEEGLPVIDAV